MSENILENLQKKQISTSPREQIFKYLRYLPWVIVSVALMMTIAYFKLRYSVPIYSVSGKLLVKKSSNPYGSGNDKFNDIFMMQGSNSNNLNDEIQVLRSRSIAARVVKSLDLQKQYFNKGKIRVPAVIHPLDMPFLLEVLNGNDSTAGLSLSVIVVNEGQFRLGESGPLYSFGQTIDLPYGKIKLVRTQKNLQNFGSNEFIVNIQPLESVAAALSGGINVVQWGEYPSNVLALSYTSENIKMGADIVNQFMIEYQKASLEDKQQVAVNILMFIDEQLKTVKMDLGSVERNLQNFQEKNRVFSPVQQSQMFFDELSASNKQLMEQGIRLKATDYIIKYLEDKKNPYGIVATTMGIEEPALIQQITEFNRLQLEHELALKTTPAANQYIRNMEAGIEKLRGELLESLRHAKEGYKVALNDISRKSGEIDQQISSMPGKQKQLLEVTRQQKILEELYSFLLQKKLETSMSSASNISNIKVLEPAIESGTLVSPNKKGMYTIFLFIGLAIPVGIILLLEYLNDKVKSKTDIERLTNAPVLGEIGHADEGGALVVTRNNRQYISEQFRIIRSNLQYILPKVEKPAIMVTSSFSGEGKSFISTNLGAVLAVSGKRTVILEFDIRKPKILEGLGLQERRGITNFIVSNIGINDIIYPVPGVDNLFVIPCGPVPPNPAEMLLDPKVQTLFDQLKKQFDIVIVDTAPVGLVSDAIILGQYVNAAMYIVRHNYTYKKQVQLIDDLYVNQKLPHLAIIINDINSGGGYGGYYGYGYYGYGYGYGSGAGSGYFEGQPGGRKGIVARIKKLFS